MLADRPYAYTEAPNQFIESRGRRLAYRAIGTGKPLVLCTRFRGNLDTWDPAFIDALAEQGFRVITFDYTGLGLSTGTPTYAPTALADDARDLIEALELEQPVIGDHDIVFPVENWYALNEQLPAVQLLTLPQAGHGPHHQHPQAVARHMAAFVHAAN